MTLALAGVLAVAIVECLIRLPVRSAVRAMAATAAKAAHVVRARGISDHWKERVLIRYSGRLFYNSALILVILAGIVGLVIGFDAAGRAALGLDLIGYLVTLEGLVVLSLVAAAYAWLRTRRVG